MGSHEILHGFDENNKEIIERVEVDGFTKKIISVDRILSVTDKFILMNYAFGRIIYWEYKGSTSDIQKLINDK